MKGKHVTTAERNTQGIIWIAIVTLLLSTLCFNRVVINLESELAALQESYNELVEEVEALKTDISEPIVKTVYLGPSPEAVMEPEVIEVIEEESVEFPELDESYDEAAIYLAKTVWGEARGCSTTEQSGVIWCILNRVDSDLSYMPNDIISVITQKDAFHGYSSKHPTIDDEGQDLVELSKDVIQRWLAEKEGIEDVGRVLPEEYLYFASDGKGHNRFRSEYKGTDYWDWSLESPYEEVG